MSDELKTLKVGGFARNILEYVSGDGIEISTDPNDGNKRIVSADGLAIIRIVSNLPATGDADTLYVVPKASGQPGNSRDEFIWVNNQWEKVGDTFVPSNYYTKIETDELISDIGGLEFVLVDTLPAEGQQGKIYLVKREGSTDRDEYIWINDAWELIGDTAVDMSNYYTKTETDSRLNTKVDKVTGKGLSTNDYTTAEKTKLQGIEAGAEVNVQADWNQTDATKDDFIKNKPDLDDFITCDTLSDCRGYFTGLTPKTIVQGEAFDPSEGVTAFSKDDVSIPFTSLPTVDTNTPGTYQVVYFANGVDPVIRNITVREDVETWRTAIYPDHTMIINESSNDISANEATHGGQALYVYDPLDATHPYEFSSASEQPWVGERSEIWDVVFGSPVAPTQMSQWFNACTNLRTIDFTGCDSNLVETYQSMCYGTTSLMSIEWGDIDTVNAVNMKLMFSESGIETFDGSQLTTGNVQNMEGVFKGCPNLTEIRLCNWNTMAVTDSTRMFADCPELVTIYADDTTIFQIATSHANMFRNDVKLVGGAGTTFSSSAVDKTRARIDGGVSAPGYFTDCTPTPPPGGEVLFDGWVAGGDDWDVCPPFSLDDPAKMYGYLAEKTYALSTGDRVRLTIDGDVVEYAINDGSQYGVSVGESGGYKIVTYGEVDLHFSQRTDSTSGCWRVVCNYSSESEFKVETI